MAPGQHGPEAPGLGLRTRVACTVALASDADRSAWDAYVANRADADWLPRVGLA